MDSTAEATPRMYSNQKVSAMVEDWQRNRDIHGTNRDEQKI